MLRNRRRPRYSPQICAFIAALLLLFSVSLLYTRLSSSPQQNTVPSSFKTQADEFSIAIDKIDEQDTIKEEEGYHQNDGNEDQNDTEEEDTKRPTISSSGYYMDHVTGSIRRYLNKKSIEDYDFSDYNSNGFSLGLNVEDYKSKTAFGSDDIVVDEEIKRKLSEVKSIEDALLLKIGKKVSPLREGWGDWFDKKSDFLRRDKMFKSNLEVLNPLTNPLLQDPDGVGVTGLTRGDKGMQKMILSEFKRNPFGGKRSLSGLGMIHNAEVGKKRGEVKRVLNEDNGKVLKDGDGNIGKDVSFKGNGIVLHEDHERNLMKDKKLSDGLNGDDGRNLMKGKSLSDVSNVEGVKDYKGDKNLSANENVVDKSSGVGGETRQMIGMKTKRSKDQQRKPEESSHILADGKRWGYFPGLHPHLSFSDFMASFFRNGNCGMRVFMVWNSPPWMHSVRHQRGLESLLSHHRDACVVIFSETIDLELNYIYRFGDFVAPMFSWFHPRNPQGILVMMTIIAFLLKRYTNVKLRAETAYRRKFWRNMMRTALTYEEWSHAAKMLDKETPKMHECDLYDEELVRNKLQELRHRRQEGCLRDIIFCMRADLVRNLGNMCNPELHKDRLQVPKLIKEYIDEVSTQLRMVCDSDSEELSLEEKLAFMHETRHAFGRTALLLSGGASLGAFHVGVVKTLVEHKLVPHIVAGSSVGSIMCAVVATRSWPELQSFFEDSWHSLQFFDQLGGIFTVVKRVMRQGVVHEIRQLQWMLRNLTSNLTFQEAYDMTGQILGITVCSPRKHEPPRCLNYLTSPHVVIWSAVTASCAFPGLFEAQELMAKDRSGEIVPYHPPFNLDPEEGSGAPMRRWRDGSLEIDLPMIQLKELFNVNHFIVSQANPHIAPLLRLKDIVRAYGGSFAAKLAHLTEMEVKHRCNQVLELGFPLGGLAKLFAQDWEGDVTVVNTATLAQYSKIIQNPTHVELQKASNQGRRCTWEKLSAIKANCGIELALDECVAILNHMRRLKRSAERAAAASHGEASSASTLKFSASKRIPSWNCIARENSTGSLEEDLLVDVASTFHQGVGVAAGTSTGRSLRTQRNLHHDGSDSESESVDLNSWTRSGGPLMRTTSANKFIDFVQSLDVDSELTKGFVCHPNSPGAQMGDRDLYNQISRLSTPDRNSESEFDPRDFSNRISPGGSSITVTEGDLLQHERILNGFVLNVVKKEDMAPSNRVHDKENHNSEVPECVQLDCPEKDMDASSSSDSAAEDDDPSPSNPLQRTASTLSHTDDPVIQDVQEKHVVDGFNFE